MVLMVTVESFRENEMVCPGRLLLVLAYIPSGTVASKNASTDKALVSFIVS